MSNIYQALPHGKGYPKVPAGLAAEDAAAVGAADAAMKSAEAAFEGSGGGEGAKPILLNPTSYLSGPKPPISRLRHTTILPSMAD